MPPSKGKKPSKPNPIISSSDRSPSAGAPSTPRRAEANEAAEEEAISRRLLLAASAEFPRLISDTAFVGRVVDVDTSTQHKSGATVWLSEAAMVSSSLPRGSLVSVTLGASGEKYLNGFPLDALSDGCAKYFGLHVGDTITNEVGSFFAIATVSSSPKVLKNGVRLSWSLSCTMGFPANGRVIFVSPVGTFPISHAPNGTDKLHTSANSRTSHFSMCTCKDLYLKLIPLDIEQVNYSESASISTLTESSLVRTRDGNVSSPKTPVSYKSSLSCSGASPLLLRRSQEYVSSVDCSSNLDRSAILMAIEDEKTNELLQICALRWFHARHLLIGNFVNLPIHGQLCVFQVQDAHRLSMDFTNQDSTNGGNYNSFPCEVQLSNDLKDTDSAFFVDHNTKVYLSKSVPVVTENSKKEDLHSSKIPGSIPRLGGLSKEFSLLKELLNFSFAQKGSLPSYRGVLLHGPPGTGKTSLATSCAYDVGAKLFSVNGPEIISQYYGDSELALQEVFESARQASPAVVFIDELDAIAPARKDGGEDLSLRIVATLLDLMDGISRSDALVVIAATNRPDSIDPALRRPGRFDREIEIGVPSPDQRLDILSTILGEMQHSLNSEEIQALALATHGFVGADLSAFCNEAATIALHRYIKFKTSHSMTIDQCSKEPCSSGDDTTDGVDQVDSLSLVLSKMYISSNPCLDHSKVLENANDYPDEAYENDREMQETSELKVIAEDFEKAKMKVRPSAMREVMLEFPKVHWEDVGGQTEVKKQLIEAVQWPQMYPDAFKRIGIRPPRGLLMFGPPGCSKTLLARAVASEAKLNFLAVKGPELFSKWVGESEKAVSSLFAKARANSPSIIFFDEIDGLATTRGQENDGTSVADRVLSQLLIELNGLDERFGVTVIAATNRPDKIDPALLRPGRFDRHLDVKPPNETEREDIFRIHMRNMPCSSDVTARDLARLTEGYTGADIKLVCREAAIAALEESFDASEVSMMHFKAGIEKVEPSDVQFYLEISEKFKRYVNTVSRKI